MFDVGKLLDECEIKFTGQQLKKLQVLVEDEIFKIIIPRKTHPEENQSDTDMSLTEDHTSNSDANHNDNPNENENEIDSVNENLGPENLNENQNQARLQDARYDDKAQG